MHFFQNNLLLFVEGTFQYFLTIADVHQKYRSYTFCLDFISHENLSKIRGNKTYYFCNVCLLKEEFYHRLYKSQEILSNYPKKDR